MDLRIDLGEARDQGKRPTCLAFALSEIHQANQNLQILLSPESLHYAGTQRVKKSLDIGLTVQEASTALDQDGQTTEASWPYNSGAPLDASCIYYTLTVLVSHFGEPTIMTALQAGYPIVLIVDVDMAFFTCSPTDAIDLDQNLQVQARHAVVICGCRQGPRGTEFLIKNSWGKDWGDNGYAWVTQAYIAARSPELIRS